MKPTTVIILAVLLAACVLFVVVSELWTPDGEKEDFVFGQVLEDINQVRITDADGGVMTFQKIADGWQMTEPMNAPADETTIDIMVARLAGLTSIQVVKSTDDPAKLDALAGLDQPRWIIELTGPSGAHTLLVGHQEEGFGGRGVTAYVRLASDGETHLVAMDFPRLLRHPIKDFRNRSVVDVQPESILSVSVNGAHAYRLYATADQWRIKTDDFDAPADSYAATLMVGACSFIAAEDFVDNPGDLEQYGLAAGQERLTVTVDYLQDGVPQQRILQLGNPLGENVYAKLEGQPDVYLAAKELLDRLQPDPNLLRDRRAAPFRPSDIFQIKIDLGEDVVELLHSQGQWRMLAPLAGNAESKAVDGFLSNLATLQAASFYDGPTTPGMFSLDEPAAEITLYATGRGEPYVVRLAHGDDDTPSHVRVDNEGPIAKMPATATEFLLAGTMHYCGRMLLDLPEGMAINHMVLQRPDSTVTVQRDPGGPWSMLQPVGLSVNEDAVAAIVDRLSHLQADRIVSIGDEAPRKLVRANARDIVRVNLALDSADGASPGEGELLGPALWVVRANSSDFHGIYAWLTTQTPVVVGQFDESLFQQLTDDLRSLEIWEIDYREITGVSITVGGDDPLVLTQSEDGWAVEGDDLTEIDDGKVESYVVQNRRLSALRHVPESADRYRAFGLDRPWLTVQFDTIDGPHRLLISKQGDQEEINRYAVVDGMADVFVISTDKVGDLLRTVDHFTVD